MSDCSTSDSASELCYTRPCKRAKTSPSSLSASMSVLVDDQFHRTVADYSSKESIRTALVAGKKALAQNLPQDWCLDIIDPNTQTPQQIESEVDRLMDLKSYHLVEAVHRGEFDEQCDTLCQTASTLLGNQFTCGITLVDMGRQYFWNRLGVINRSIPRKLGFCAHAMQYHANNGVIVVPDLSEDPRFSSNPFVTDFLQLRFYAAAPLITEAGHKIGCFAISGYQARPEGITAAEQDILVNFADIAMHALTSYRKIETQRLQLTAASGALAAAAHDLLTPLQGLQLSTALLMEEHQISQHSNQQSSQQEKLKKSGSKCQLLQTASHCVDSMVAICDSLRTTEARTLATARMFRPPQLPPLIVQQGDDDSLENPKATSSSPSATPYKKGPLKLSSLVERLNKVLEAVPSLVPVHITIDKEVPKEVIVPETPLFRACLNGIRLALQRCGQNGETGAAAHFQIQLSDNGKLKFVCRDTGPPVAAIHGKCRDVDADKITVGCTAHYEHMLHHCASIGANLMVESSSLSNDHVVTTCFFFHLPLQVPLRDTEEAPMSSSSKKTSSRRRSIDQISKQPPPTRTNDRKRTVLIVDDSAIIRKMLSRAVRQLGYEPEVACHGMEGLEKMRSTVYDFCLLDFLMPVMDGLDAIRELRSWEKQHRPTFRQYVVGISAHASGNDANKGLLLGMDDFHSKPLCLKDLKRIADRPEVRRVTSRLDALHDEYSIGGDSKESCLVVGSDDSVKQSVFSTIQEKGWIPVAACNKNEFLTMLKSRNWDAVVVDGDLPDWNSSLQEFRRWESQNRVRKQRNLFCLQPSASVSSSPPGVDGVLDKSIARQALERMLHAATGEATLTADDIVTR